MKSYKGPMDAYRRAFRADMICLSLIVLTSALLVIASPLVAIVGAALGVLGVGIFAISADPRGHMKS